MFYQFEDVTTLFLLFYKNVKKERNCHIHFVLFVHSLCVQHDIILFKIPASGLFLKYS